MVYLLLLLLAHLAQWVQLTPPHPVQSRCVCPRFVHLASVGVEVVMITPHPAWS